MKIYTKTGDKGETSLVDGTRVPKSHPRVDAYGSVDELNSILGICVSMSTESTVFSSVVKKLCGIQNTLFNLGSLLACSDQETKKRLPTLTHEDIDNLEKEIDIMSKELPPLREFILPGGHVVASFLHQARTVCRRAERKVSTLEGDDGDIHLKYLNRLSDYLFVLARYVNFKSGTIEVTWKKD